MPKILNHRWSLVIKQVLFKGILKDQLVPEYDEGISKSGGI